ncbi:18828_t:CDS:1, partial [Gigaspora margarita]
VFHHRIASLLPNCESIPQYLQIYIWDTQYELQHRSNTTPNSNLSPTILQGLKNILDQVNLYVVNFRSIADLPMENIENLVMCIHTNISGLDQRTHNAPTALQVAVIWVDDDVSYATTQTHDIILCTSMGHLMRISEFSGYYDPMAYPLLFPYSEQEWAPRQILYRDFSHELTLDNSRDNYIGYDDSQQDDHSTNTTQQRRYVTAMDYYAYHLQIRPNQTNLLLQAERFFQQFVIDMYVKIEANRLNFHRKNRSNLYQGLRDAVLNGDNNPKHISHRIVLPSTFIGGP